MDKRQKILIVDDAKFNRDILKEILGDAYNYLEAEDGNQAIQMIGENIGIDLMLLDINMPQMNGFEVLKIMKRSQCIAETPVIMISKSIRSIPIFSPIIWIAWFPFSASR